MGATNGEGQAGMGTVPHWIEQGSGRRALVFLHGIGGSSRSFDWQLPAFAERWRAIAWDMPGYGASALEGEMTWGLLARSLVGLLDHLELDAAVFVGHSMGGMVAQELAASHPERVDGLVLSATSASFGSADGEFQRRFLAERLAPLDRGLAPADFAAEVMPAMFKDHATPEAIARAIASMAAIPAATYRAASHCLVSFNRREDLGTLACPTLVLAGEKDTIAPPKGMQRMAEQIADARYRVIDGVGHLANLERPEAFNAAIAEFLDAAGLATR